MAARNNGAVRVGTLKELEAQRCVVVAGDHGPIAVFYDQGKAFAVDNRCPHMGFPLHRGTVQDGILTCHWHHARFDLASGCTFNLFADDVPTYPVAVRDGEVWLTPYRERADEASQWKRRLVEGLEQNISLVIAKSVIGLLSAGVPYGEIARIGILFGTRNRASGWASGLTILAAMTNLCRHLPAEEQTLPLYQGLLHVARDCAGQPPRRELQPLGSREVSPETLRRWFRSFVEVRDEEGAERCLRTLIASGADAATVSEMMLAAATDHLYLDGGHTIDFINKAFESLETIGWQHAATVLPSLVPGLCRAGRREESQSWRCPVDLVALLEEAFEGLRIADCGLRIEESVPVLQSAIRNRAPRAAGSSAIVPTLLGDSPHAIVAALTEALVEGARPVDLAQAVATAAALRICRFGTQNEFGDWIAVLHTFTYANALHQSLRRSSSAELVRGIYHGAMSVYLDRYLNVPPARLPEERRRPAAGSASALSTADPEAWRERLLDQLNRQQQVEAAATLTHDYLQAGLPPGRWYRTLAVALLREDAEFHSFQMLEAAVRHYEALQGTPAAGHALIAAARYLAAHAPTDRARNQTARIALRLHRGDALYEEEALVTE
jgi:nitrite reductase/ring-hydroxylating ferredoxin subunit